MAYIHMSKAELNFRRELMRFRNSIKALGQYEGTVVNDKYYSLEKELTSYENLLDNNKDVSLQKLQGVATRLKQLRGGGKSKRNRLYEMVDVVDVETGEILGGSSYKNVIQKRESPHNIFSMKSAYESSRDYVESLNKEKVPEEILKIDKGYNEIKSTYSYSTAVLDSVWEWFKEHPHGIAQELQQDLTALLAKYNDEERVANMFEHYASEFDCVESTKVTYDDIVNMQTTIALIDDVLGTSINNEAIEIYEEW